MTREPSLTLSSPVRTNTRLETSRAAHPSCLSSSRVARGPVYFSSFASSPRELWPCFFFVSTEGALFSRPLCLWAGRGCQGRGFEKVLGWLCSCCRFLCFLLLQDENTPPPKLNRSTRRLVEKSKVSAPAGSG